jgi:hypothetical protein
VSWTCGTHGGGERIFTVFRLGGPKVRDHWEDLGVGGRIKLERTLVRQGSMGRTGFSWLRVRVQWRVCVNTVMNLRVP